MMENITIMNYIILSIILTVICIIVRVIDIIIIQNGRKKRKIINVELPNGNIQKIETKHVFDIKAHRMLLVNMVVSASLAFLSLMTAAIFNKIAVTYGAYGDYQTTLTPKLIIEMTQKSFVDQSSDLPDNLNGKIVIYYRYDCRDCADIHDDLMTYLSEIDASDIYFVSSRSEKGKNLINTYPVYEVPSVIYIYNDPVGENEYVAAPLFQKATDGSLFIKENMDTIMAAKREGI